MPVVCTATESQEAQGRNKGMRDGNWGLSNSRGSYRGTRPWSGREMVTSERKQPMALGEGTADRAGDFHGNHR